MAGSSALNTAPNVTGSPYRVLVVDDSRNVREFLLDVLTAEPRLEVVGCAKDADEAGEMLRRLSPDVMTLDINMPGTDGLTFLKRTMRIRPLPVLMLSVLTEPGAPTTLYARDAGAVDSMCKRAVANAAELDKYAKEIVQRILKAATVRVGPWSDRTATTKPLPDLDCVTRRLHSSPSVGDRQHGVTGDNADRTAARVTAVRSKGSLARLVAFGASTGGPEALRKVLTEFHAPDCAIVISQHMPENFMKPFAARLDQASRFSIQLAQDGQCIEPGCGYVAPGDRHLRVISRDDSLYCVLSTDPKVNGHRPSVDIMFDSICEAAVSIAMGVLLTGMGEDGARGLKKLHDAGVPTIVQDKFSSAVWGMPGRAFELGAADQTLSLDCVGPALNAVLGGRAA